MKKYLPYLIFLVFTSQSFAWDFGAKLEFERSSTDNVNLTEAAQVKDSYNTLNGYLQVKNETYKIKLRAKKDQYHVQQANDNYLMDLSAQYKHSSNDDYTFGVFKQVYDGATIISTDTTSDNLGARLGATFSRDFYDNVYGYLAVNVAQKRYPKIVGRTDKIIGSLLGIEYNATTYLMINPEFNLQKNSSITPYYSNLAFGPTLTVSVSPIDRWEVFVVSSYAKTSYSGRVYTILIDGVPQSENETQSLLTMDYGTSYKFSKKVSIEAKYSQGKNNSNNPASSYMANIVSFNLSLKI
jgi:hypothetical protein